MFQFTHPVWGATYGCVVYPCGAEVSIHAPRVGCDLEVRGVAIYRLAFQFTHPVWGATVKLLRCASARRFQFTHPVWGATSGPTTNPNQSIVSIHAPRVGCDACSAVASVT